MDIKELKHVLEANPDHELCVALPNGELVPPHFHITEVGRVQKDFIDCGGVVRSLTSCSLQVWYAHDFDHRLHAGKLLKILELGETLGLSGLSVEIEYGVGTISLYSLSKVEATERELVLLLEEKRTACLAPDKCGVTACNTDNGCC